MIFFSQRIGKNGILMKGLSPGPANYPGVPTENYRTKAPRYTVPGKLPPALKSATPGPAAYLPNPPKVCNAGYSFGLKVCAAPYITADDELPCIVR